MRALLVVIGVAAAGLIGWVWLYISLVASAPCAREQLDAPSICGPLTPALGVLFAIVGFIGIAALAGVAWQAIASLRAPAASRQALQILSLAVALCMALQVLLIFAIRASRPDAGDGSGSNGHARGHVANDPEHSRDNGRQG